MEQAPTEAALKLFHVIIIWDCFAVANDALEARNAVKHFIKHENMQPTEETALEASSEHNIRASWRDQKPLVGADVSDADFEKRVKGRTVIQMFEALYKKQIARAKESEAT
jgi:hypothetical protein